MQSSLCTSAVGKNLFQALASEVLERPLSITLQQGKRSAARAKLYADLARVRCGEESCTATAAVASGYTVIRSTEVSKDAVLDLSAPYAS